MEKLASKHIIKQSVWNGAYFFKATPYIWVLYRKYKNRCVLLKKEADVYGFQDYLLRVIKLDIVVINQGLTIHSFEGCMRVQVGGKIIPYGFFTVGSYGIANHYN